MDKIKKIQDLMNNNRLYGELVDYTENMVAIEIAWGDWKHDHLRLKWLIQENMPEVKDIDSIITEDDGSDCYSAIHKFFF